MKTVFAVICGLISGFMIYLIATFLLTDGEPSGLFIAVTFLGGTALSIWLFLKGALTLSSVLLRVFLVGAAEWLAFIPASTVLSAKTAGEMIDQTSSGAEAAGAALGAGLFSFLSGTLAIIMALICLIGAAIAYFVGRDAREQAKMQQASQQEAA